MDIKWIHKENNKGEKKMKVIQKKFHRVEVNRNDTGLSYTYLVESESVTDAVLIVYKLYPGLQDGGEILSVTLDVIFNRVIVSEQD